MPDAKGTLLDGFTSLEGGMDSGRSAEIIASNQYALAENVSIRGGFAKTSPQWKRVVLTSDADLADFSEGRFQGADFFSNGSASHLVAIVSGRCWRIDVDGTATLATYLGGQTAQRIAWLPTAWTQQVEGAMVIQDGNARPWIYDGLTVRTAGMDEVPSGCAMAYGMGRLWVARTGRQSFVAGDLYGTDTGPLKFTENTYLAEGGDFAVPTSAGKIVAMQFTAQNNTALGVGALLVFCERCVSSVDAPTDRTTWKDLQYPIQRVLLNGVGAVSPWGLANVNGDVFFRSPDGIRSIVVALRDFNSWGNVSMSNELQRIMDYEDQAALAHCSMAYVDGRLLTTMSPVRSCLNYYNRGLAITNFDLLGSIQGKTNPAYEGVEKNGLYPVKLVTGTMPDGPKCWMFALDSTGVLQLWERVSTGHETSDELTRTSAIETRRMTFQVNNVLKKLLTAEVWRDEIKGLVSWDVYYRPDSHPNWILWESWCDHASDGMLAPALTGMNAQQFRNRKILQLPTDSILSSSGMSARTGYDFQFRIEWTGQARLRKFIVKGEVPDMDVVAYDHDSTCTEELLTINPVGVFSDTIPIPT
jgi:hypothetical protein